MVLGEGLEGFPSDRYDFVLHNTTHSGHIHQVLDIAGKRYAYARHRDVKADRGLHNRKWTDGLWKEDHAEIDICYLPISSTASR